MGGGSERWDKASLIYPSDPGQGWTRPSLLTVFSSLFPLAILKLGVLGTERAPWSCQSQSFKLALLAASTRGK